MDPCESGWLGIKVPYLMNLALGAKLASKIILRRLEMRCKII